MFEPRTRFLSVVAAALLALTGCATETAPEQAATTESGFTKISYDGVMALEGEALKSGLFALVKDHTRLGYDRARETLFGDRDFFRADGMLECAYTGRVVTPTGSTSVGSFNTEHTWPQSLGASREPARSDLHHLFPVDARMNSTRGNHPFGSLTCLHETQPTEPKPPTKPTEPEPEPTEPGTEPGTGAGVTPPVTGEETTEGTVTEAELPACTQASGGSALGKNFAGRTAFEVRKENRGNTARAIFYFSVRYQLHIDQDQETTLRVWNDEDPVDEPELKRNDAVQKVQHNRNPFIDHPEFVAKIADF